MISMDNPVLEILVVSWKNVVAGGDLGGKVALVTLAPTISLGLRKIRSDFLGIRMDSDHFSKTYSCNAFLFDEWKNPHSS